MMKDFRTFFNFFLVVSFDIPGSTVSIDMFRGATEACKATA